MASKAFMAETPGGERAVKLTIRFLLVERDLATGRYQ